MGKDKNRHTIWLDDDIWKMVGLHYKANNCTTQNEFIEQAIQFYCGYLDTEQEAAFLPVTLSTVLEGSRGALGDRLGKLRFKMSVEMSMMMHLMAHDTDATLNELEQLRGRCVQDVMRTHGMLSFKEIFRFQKRL